MATSDGHLHWHRSLRSFFDFSVFALKDKAIKGSWSGQAWSTAEVERKIEDARAKLDILFRPSVVLSPGRYRAVLSSEAVSDLLGLACWGLFGQGPSHLTKPFFCLAIWGKAALFKGLLVEDLQDFGVPRVQELGFLRPNQMPLISKAVSQIGFVAPELPVSSVSKTMRLLVARRLLHCAWLGERSTPVRHLLRWKTEFICRMSGTLITLIDSPQDSPV